ncbi:MAG: N-formylglutamate amidohydrolase [Brevundimonas sp.]|uniref:N-formylglutamate amidohydrolase n=2 Tax=Brevundimonas albigilva TaxID=1312364 RepID=A0ABY4SLW2_9CAUL|nr:MULTISPECIES: N-formylglutamate amidohydrolase [Brevundimonas]PZU54026.1 MAG: N-formylglutamate amidohydrolase [Brevundimonas sp.]URI15060.1 N-formylglutamate amidohydrolase [Brevundimonas albigilva]
MTGGDAPFLITRPPASAPRTALVFASPHSGDRYPADMAPAPGLSSQSLRSAEDALVARLIEDGPAHGAPLIEGRIGRAYLDLNRDPHDLDPALVDGAPIPAGPKAAAGYGVAPRLAGDGAPLYDRRLTLAEVQARIAEVHAPYHRALGELMRETRAEHGRAVLIDWHSMPARAADVEVVLGDRHGSACATRLTRRLRALFEGLGWRVALNHPYAGGWSTQQWGRPDDGVEAIQIEINRRLYLDETTLSPGAGWGRTRRALGRVVAGLCAESWAG